MEEPERITVYNGKYTVIVDPNNFRALRYGEEWRSLVGDGMVLALCQEILDLKEKLKSRLDPYEYRFGSYATDMWVYQHEDLIKDGWELYDTQPNSFNGETLYKWRRAKK